MFRIAIVGRPNVGKSALFNRLVGEAISIVHNQPGVTRDRVSAVIERKGGTFEFMDTGGIGLFEDETTPLEIAKAVQVQVEIAIETADLILIVVDGLEGIRPLDEEVVGKLRKSGKKLCLVINKLDLAKHEIRAAEFFRLGMESIFYVSASHGRGIEQLWEMLEEIEREKRDLKEEVSIERVTDDQGSIQNAPRIVVVGRPNVGKSSLVNRLLNTERVIVSKTPGTTRDSLELPLNYGGTFYQLIDTAGIRNKSRIRANVEMYSRHKTEKSIIASDVVLLMLSAPDGSTRQDREIAGLILKHQKPCIILVNKWDLNEILDVQDREVQGRRKTIRKTHRVTSRSMYEKELRAKMPFLEYAPVIFISAFQGYHALAIWKQVDEVLKARRFVFTTGVLNRVFARCQERVQPPMRQGKRLKIYYVTQKTDAPIPTFVVFINQRRLWVDHFARYLMNQLRKEQPLSGCPILFHLREHSSKFVTSSSPLVRTLDEG